MMIRKITVTFCALLCLIILLCSCGDVIVDPKWIIGVKGADTSYFSSIEYGQLREVTITVEKEQQDGSVIEEEWKGVRLKDVLDFLDITNYASITLSSSDDYSIEYTPDIINDPLTILGTNVNGRDIKYEDGYVQTVAGNQPESMWVKKPNKMTVNE